MKTRIWIAALAVALPLLLLNSRLWPLGAVVDGDIGGDFGLFQWNVWHATEAVFAGRNPFWTGLIYYPLGGYLAKHTYVFGLVPVGLAAKLASGDSAVYPIYAYRSAIWLSFAGGTIAAFAALRALDSGTLASLWGAVAFVYSCAFRAHTPHLNVLSGAFLIPLLTLVAVRAWRRPSRGSFAVFGVVVGLSVYYGEYSLLGILALLVAVGLVGLSRYRSQLRSRVCAGGLSGVTWAVIAATLCALPFLVHWSRDEGKAPKASAAEHSSADLLGFLKPSPAKQPLYAWLGREQRREGTGIGGREVFVGGPLLVLLLAMLVTPGPIWRPYAVCLGIVFLVLALGPALHVGGPVVAEPLPYRWLATVPPLNMARTPIRLWPIALWAFVCAGAATLTHLMTALAARGRPRTAYFLAALAILWSTAEGYRAGPPVRAFEPPVELLDLPAGAVVNLPIDFQDGHAVFFQIFHGRPIMTGFLARRTVEQVEYVRRLDETLNNRGPAAFIQEVSRLGCRTVIIRTDPRDRAGYPENVLAELKQQAASANMRFVDLRFLGR